MIQRIKRKEVKFEESQFYLIQVSSNNEGFYQFIDKDTLHVICATTLERMETCMLNIFRKYKSYDILNRRLKNMEFYQMSAEEKEERHKECRIQGERLSYLVDETISQYYKSLEEKTITKKTLIKKTIQDQKRPEAPESRPRPQKTTEETKTLQLQPRPLKRRLRSL